MADETKETEVAEEEIEATASDVEEVESEVEVAEADDAAEEVIEEEATERRVFKSEPTVSGPADQPPVFGNSIRNNLRRGRGRSHYIELLKDKTIDYKDVNLLTNFITPRGKIRPRRQTNVSAKQQRAIARAIKQARQMALLPYTDEHIREHF